MLSWIDYLRSSITRGKRSLSAGEKRTSSSEDDYKLSSADVIQTQPNKRSKTQKQEDQPRDKENTTQLVDFLGKAMSWADKYTYWKKKNYESKTRNTVQQYREDDDVLCTGVVRRQQHVSSDVICLDDRQDDDRQDDVICIGDSPPRAYTSFSKAENTYATAIDSNLKRRPLDQVHNDKPSRPYIPISTPARPPVYTGRPHVSSAFQVPASTSHHPVHPFTSYDANKYRDPDQERTYQRRASPSRLSSLQNAKSIDNKTHSSFSHSISQGSSEFDSSRIQGSFTVGHHDSKIQGRVRVARNKPTVRRLANSCRQKTTAEGVVRLKEKELYRQLLSQFTLLAGPPEVQEADKGKENVSLEQSNNTSVFKTPHPRSSDFSVLSPRRSPVQTQPPVHSTPVLHSTPVVHFTPVVKVIASPTNLKEVKSHVEDLPLYFKPAPSLSRSKLVQSRSSSSPPADDPLLSNWTKKWRDILSPDNQAREREQARITLEEEKLKTLREKRKQEEESAIQEVQERIRQEEEADQDEDAHFVSLSEDMEQMVDEALAPGNPSDNLAEGFKVKITRGDLATLSNLNWLNDEVMNFYFSMIGERSNTPGYPKVHFFNSFFYPKLIKAGHASLKRWTRKVDIFAVDIILVPIHLGMHWCLAAVDFRKKTITYYDSLKGSNRQCLEALCKYLKDESVDKKKVPFDMTGWTSSCPKDIPEQLNGCDCGVFACTYAEYLARDAKFTFDQFRMPCIRRRMVYEILTKNLL